VIQLHPMVKQLNYDIKVQYIVSINIVDPQKKTPNEFLTIRNVIHSLEHKTSPFELIRK